MLYLIFHGQTEAMRCRRALQKHLIAGTLTRPPERAEQESCSWAVRIAAGDGDAARRICIRESISLCGQCSEEAEP